MLETPEPWRLTWARQFRQTTAGTEPRKHLGSVASISPAASTAALRLLPARNGDPAPPVQVAGRRRLGETLHNWRNEIGWRWHFTRNNSITGGLHTKMEVINRRIFGFRNFNNHRMRVKVLSA